MFSVISVLIVVLHGTPRAQEEPPERAVSRGRGSISGVVTKQPSGEPAAGAVVKILNEPFSYGPPGAQTQSAIAGPDGSFLIPDVEAGTYWMVANLQGFLPFEYGQRSPTGVGTSFDVRANQRVTARLALWPTSGIAGHVIDVDGDPVARVQVLALQSVYEDGKPSLTIAQSVMTNDRGEYRMFWLTPGSYRVAARSFEGGTIAPVVNIGPPRRFGSSQQGSSPVVTRQASTTGAVVEEVAVPIYAPGTSNPQLATAVVLAPGENAAGIDIQFVGSRVPARHVRGIVQNMQVDGERQIQQRVLVVPRVPSPMAVVAGGVVRPDGSFDVGGVAPGSYTVFAADGAAAALIDVGDADVDNLVLTVTSGVAIAGRVTVERGTVSGDVDLSNFRFQVARDPEVIGAPPGGPRFNPPPAADGTFSWNISPGDFRVSVQGLGRARDDRTRAGGGPRLADVMQNAYVKSIRSGRNDVLVDGLHTWGGGQAPLEIVVSLAGAEVEGTVRDNARRPAANAVIVAVPDGSNRGRTDLYRNAIADAAGHFALRGLAPGDYSFYAWDDLERGSWESVEFLRSFEGRGHFVRLREGRNDTLDLNLVVGR